jgi:hypothetical protein
MIMLFHLYLSKSLYAFMLPFSMLVSLGLEVLIIHP